MSNTGAVGTGGFPSANTTTETLPILPYVIGDITTSGSGSGFVTYDTTQGLRLLVTLEHDPIDAAGPAAADAGKNVYYSGAGHSLVNATVAINSFFSTGSGTAGGNGGGNTLTVTSGAMAFTTSYTATGGHRHCRLR